MAEFRLHCFGESGNAYKAALMLKLCGADWEAAPIDFFNGATRDGDWRARLNEMGEAPVLEFGDERLTQSGVILDYLAERFRAFGWADEDERRAVYRWILFDNHKFTSYLASHRFLTYFLDQGGPVIDFLKTRMEAALAIAEAHLEDREWVALERPTIADISMAGYVYYDGETGVDWTDYPALARWRERVRELPGWKGPYDLMPKAPERRA